jgi:formylglycine-generating enzyme required for sulfatase activity
MHDDIIAIFEYIGEKNPRLLRGGTFVNLPQSIRSAYHLWNAPSSRSTYYGFRLARTYN